LEFCPKCKSLLLEDRKKKIFVCKKCHFEKSVGEHSEHFVESLEKPKETVIVKEEGAKSGDPLPVTKAECTKCGNVKAYYWMMQTRGADEPSTRFYRCTKCSHTWREYE
jgi:DNA-directed RNA polymerase subunit M